MSFSYKKGIPEDKTVNGGGFVFDCRAVNNPGRHAQYAALTGLDAEVATYLENDGEILQFLQDAYNLADRAVARYLERGFTDLMVAFGCTGGQHRSVYSAENMAKHLNDKFGVEIFLEHRELNIKKLFLQKK
jgi:RNase adaptor protein for sRNA GlmZ degradation